MNPLAELTLKLAECQFRGHQFNCLPIQGEQPVLRVEVSGLEAIPIFVTITETQILCISYLFTRMEIHADKEAELNRCLLELNLPMPLSAFALVDDYYVVFGALSRGSKFESICEELVTLANNATDTLQALEEFIQ